MIKSVILSKFPEITHGISTKDYGNMKLSAEFDLRQAVENRKKFCTDLNISINNLINIDLAHTANIAIVDKNDAGRGARDIESLISQTDGLTTNKQNIFLMVTGADCPPVFCFDQIKKVVGIIHVGWRGLLAGIVENMISIFKDKYGCKVENLNVFIGPGIGSCHFEVGDGVVKKFNEEYQQFVVFKNNKKFIDLKGIIKFILLNNGLKNDNIEVSLDCTYCQDDLYSSYRREGKNFKPMGAVIGLNI